MVRRLQIHLKYGLCSVEVNWSRGKRAEGVEISINFIED